MKRIKGNIENVEKMIKDLDYRGCSFNWDDTPQGSNYWIKVFNNLRIVLDKMEPKVCSKCGQEIKG
ncbi:MAG: hypothetical protein U9Q73_00510 [Nanoarchaeota archaeon]|nr:hypothetical protein [Nanoarchaeota archaeon]